VVESRVAEESRKEVVQKILVDIFEDLEFYFGRDVVVVAHNAQSGFFHL